MSVIIMKPWNAINLHEEVVKKEIQVFFQMK